MLRSTAFALTMALALTACGVNEQDETTRDDNGAVVEGGEVGVFALQEGDCFGPSPDGEVASLDIVPCAEEHESEIYHLFDVELDAFDEARIDELAGDGCFEAFEPYTGVSYDISFYDFTALLPTAESWAAGDREVVCILVPFEGGTTTGTAKGAGLTLEGADA